MPKGYWVARMTVTDQAKYDAYRSSNGPVFAKFGGRFIVRGGEFENPEGSAHPRNVVIEFPTYQAARDCWHSPEYQDVMAKRLGGTEIDLIIIEGYEGPQPGD